MRGVRWRAGRRSNSRLAGDWLDDWARSLQWKIILISQGTSQLDSQQSSQIVKQLQTEIEGLKGLLKITQKYHKEEIKLLESSHACVTSFLLNFYLLGEFGGGGELISASCLNEQDWWIFSRQLYLERYLTLAQCISHCNWTHCIFTRSTLHEGFLRKKYINAVNSCLCRWQMRIRGCIGCMCTHRWLISVTTKWVSTIRSRLLFRSKTKLLEENSTRRENQYVCFVIPVLSRLAIALLPQVNVCQILRGEVCMLVIGHGAYLCSLKDELDFSVTQCRDRITQMEKYHEASRGDLCSTVSSVKGDAAKTIETLRNEHV